MYAVRDACSWLINYLHLTGVHFHNPSYFSFLAGPGIEYLIASLHTSYSIE